MRKLMMVLTVLFMSLVFVSCGTKETEVTKVTRVINYEDLHIRAGIAYALNEQEPYSGKMVDLGSPGWHRPKQEAMYKNGKLEGIRIIWHLYPNRRTKQSEATFKNGEVHGIATSWYSNGQKELEGTCKNGKLHGLHKSWDMNGQITFEGTYENDKLID